MSEKTKNSNKRKRKKTFLSNARKYGKKGYYGRGTKLDEDTYQYFVRIMETYKEGFPTEEEKHLFVNNVFEQTDEQEITCSCNQFGCRVIETLLPFANDAVMDKFMTAISSDLRPLCCDRFASHVIEALLREAVKRSQLQTESEMYSAFVIKVSRFMLNNMEDYMWDTYGNHTMRGVFHSICNIPKEEKKIFSKEKENPVKEELVLSDDFREIVKDYAQRLLSWPQFVELPSSELTSGFLQVLLKALHKVDTKLLHTYLKRLINDIFAQNTEDPGQGQGQIMPGNFLTTATLMLLETSLQVANEKYYSLIYTKCFKSFLLKLSLNKATNFAVQKLFLWAQNKEEFEAMFDELNDTYDQVLQVGHSGVLLALAQSCKRLGARQGPLVQNMSKALKCTDERQNKLIPSLCKLQPYDDASNETPNLEKDKLNLHGTLILQTMLDFNKPIKLVNALLAMDKHELAALLSNTMGSHITDSYVKSAFVGEKSRERLVRTLAGCYQQLAAGKHGSRSFDALWQVAGMKQRLAIMDELAYREAGWANGDFGKIIANKVHLPVYKKSKEEWKSAIAKSEQKNRNMLDDVLGWETTSKGD